MPQGVALKATRYSVEWEQLLSIMHATVIFLITEKERKRTETFAHFILRGSHCPP